MSRISRLFSIIILLSTISIYGQSHLPVELVYFKYEILDSTLTLEWGTATEVQCYGFNLERYSAGTWYTLPFVPGHGDSNTPWDYSFVDTTAIKSNTYLYRLKQIDVDGGYKYSDTLTVLFLTGIKKEGDNVPDGFLVSQNYPNPFNPTTNIDVKIPLGSEIKLKVFDVKGKLVSYHNYGERYPGIYSLSFDGSNLSSGVYYYTIYVGQFRRTHSMVLLK